jgi:hypothetical protein
MEPIEPLALNALKEPIEPIETMEPFALILVSGPGCDSLNARFYLSGSPENKKAPEWEPFPCCLKG